MEISNKIITQNFGIFKNKVVHSKAKNATAFRGNGGKNTQDSGNLGKAKIALDSSDKKILSYEEKLEILEAKGFDKKAQAECLKYDDEDFRKIIHYNDIGMSLEEAQSFLNYHSNDEYAPLVLELVESSIPYSYAKDIGTSKERHGDKYFDEEKIKILKEAKFDFSDKVKDFKIREWELSEVFGSASRNGNEEKYKTFCELHKRKISGNIILNAISKGEFTCENLKKVADIKEIKLSNNTKCAYYMYNIMPSQMRKITEICEKFKLNPEDYNSWGTIAKTRALEETEKLLEAGIPFDLLGMEIKLDKENLEKAIKYSKDNKLDLAPVITIMQAEHLDEQKKEKSLEYFKNEAINENIAIQLTEYEDEIAQEIIKYITAGLNPNNANVLSHYKLDQDKKEEILNLVLDKTFNHVSDAKEYIELDLTKEERDKTLELIKLGACIPLAVLCAKDETGYKEALDLINSGKCETLREIYAYDIDSFLSSAKLIKLGVPQSNLGLYAYGLEEEHKELLSLNVPFETVEKIKRGELELITTNEIKELLKKGVDYETACKLYKHLGNDKDKFKTILEVAGKNLDAQQIITLAQIQQDGEPFKKEDLPLVQAFASRMKDLEQFKILYELGLFNEKALKNYDELIKRGLKYKNSLQVIAVSQIDFRESKEIDRACELLKNNVGSHYIPFHIKDDNAAKKAITNERFIWNSYREDGSFSGRMAKFIKSGIPLEDVEKICEYVYSENELKLLDKFLKKGHSVKDAVKITKKYLLQSSPTASEDETDKRRELISDYVLKGATVDFVAEIVSNEKSLKNFENLIAEGIEPIIAEKMVICGIDKKNEKALERIKTFCNSNLKDELIKANSNPLLEPMIAKLYDFKNYDTSEFQRLINSDTTVEDIKKSAQIFIKSPLKQAMKHPNLYLSGIPSEDTEKIDGKYPKLSDEKLERYQNQMIEFFKFRMSEITKVLKYMDIDTFNQMMDKRTTIFSAQLEMLYKMDNKHFKIASEITKCRKPDGKLLSAKEKIDLSKIILYHQLGYLDTDYLEAAIKDRKVDVEKLNERIFEKLIEVIGIEPEKIKDIPEEKLDFDKEYMYLLLRTQESADFLLFKEILANNNNSETAKQELEDLLKQPDEVIIHQGLTRKSCENLIKLLDKMPYLEEKEIYQEFSRISPFTHVDCSIQEVAKIALTNDFMEYITQGENKYAINNTKTEKQFRELGLNYDTWLKYDEKNDIEIEGGEYSIKLWDRNPQKDLFMGNRTSCCTAVIDGGNGKATPIYLTNTAFNVVELKDKSGNIVGMSRIFVANIDEKPAIIVENIELNNAFLKDKKEEEMKKLRDNMLGYIKDFAKSISKDGDMKVYFSRNYTHVPTDDYKLEEKNIEFVGSTTSESIYLNCKPGWVKPEELKKEACELYEV